MDFYSQGSCAGDGGEASFFICSMASPAPASSSSPPLARCEWCSCTYNATQFGLHTADPHHLRALNHIYATSPREYALIRANEVAQCRLKLQDVKIANLENALNQVMVQMDIMRAVLNQTPPSSSSSASS
jgi:hypothetical protein